MGEPYRAHLSRVASDVEGLARRTHHLATFRAQFGRRLSAGICDDLTTSADGLERMAADLRHLATARPETLAELIATARKLGVDV